MSGQIRCGVVTALIVCAVVVSQGSISISAAGSTRSQWLQSNVALASPSPATALSSAVSVGDAVCIQTVGRVPFTTANEVENCEGAAAEAGGTKPPTPDDTQMSTTRRTGLAGSATPGTTTYQVPDAALFVSSAGHDSNPGSRAAPLRTTARAIALATSGSTIVLRGGTYHEAITIPVGKKLTIQSYPNEEVWFDGSSIIGTWTSDGGAWRGAWGAEFDASHLHLRGRREHCGGMGFRQCVSAYGSPSRSGLDRWCGAVTGWVENCGDSRHLLRRLRDRHDFPGI